MSSNRHCVIAAALLSVSGQHLEALSDIVDRPFTEGGLTSDRAAVVMKQAGLRSSASAVTRHRRGECSCIGRLGDEREPTRPTP